VGWVRGLGGRNARGRELPGGTPERPGTKANLVCLGGTLCRKGNIFGDGGW